MQLIKKRERYTQQIRRKHKAQIKTNLRNILLQQRCQQQKQAETNFINVSSNHQVSEKNHKNLEQFYQKIEELLANKFPQLNLTEDPRYLYAKILDICYLNINQQRKLTVLQQLGSVFESLIQLYQKYLLYSQTDNIPLNNSHESQQWNHLLNIALIQLKMNVNSDGNQSLVQMYFTNWIKSVLTSLSQVYDDQQRIQYDINIELEYTLKEINFFCKIHLQLHQIQSYQSILQKIFTEQLIKKLNFAIRNYRVSDINKTMISMIFVQLTITKNQQIYIFLLQEYLQFIRMTIAFTEAYRQNDPYNENVIANRLILKNILLFIHHSCQIYSSDVFWQRGICSELKLVEREGIKDRSIHQKVAEILFQCIVSIGTQKACEYLQEADMMDWLLSFLNETIQNSYWSKENKKIFIENSIMIIQFFFQLGENMKMSKSSSNPYQIKFKYSFGEEILSKCQQGIEFLRKYSQNNEQV